MKIEIKSFEEYEGEEYLEWAKANGKCNYELADVYIKDNGELKIEQKMCWVMKTSPDDYKQFCKETGREFEEVKVLVYYGE